MKNVTVLDAGVFTNNPFQLLRPDFSKTFPTIKNTLQMRATLRAGQYAWPGGYQMYLITLDGSSLCFECGRKEYAQISSAIRYPRSNDQWRVIGTALNYEDNDCACDHCGKKIPASYGEQDDEA